MLDGKGRKKRKVLEVVFEEVTRLLQEVNNGSHDCVDEQHKYRKRNSKNKPGSQLFIDSEVQNIYRIETPTKYLNIRWLLEWFKSGTRTKLL